MKRGRTFAITIVCIILGITLALQYKGISTNQKMASYENKRADELKDELIRLQKNNDDLSKKIEELTKENIEYESKRGDISEMTKKLSEDIKKAKIIAGLMDVKGKGVIVTIDNGDIANVEDSDILNVLNELRATDAQAISINDERIIATSEVRVAGKYIMVNGRQMLAPFIIKAIAQPDKVEHSLKMMGGIIEKLEAYQLKVMVEKSDNIVINKVRDDGSVIRIDLLTPVESK